MGVDVEIGQASSSPLSASLRSAPLPLSGGADGSQAGRPSSPLTKRGRGVREADGEGGSNDQSLSDKATPITTEALTWVGTPYRHQGRRKGVGCDCLGLLIGVWCEVYGAAPEEPGPYAADWAEAGGADSFLGAARRHCREKPLSEMGEGDLILFRWRPHLPAKHAAILISPDRFVHAYEGSAVVVSTLVPQWRKRIAAVFAFPEV